MYVDPDKRYHSGQAALSIQAYLAFCALTNQNQWSITFDTYDNGDEIEIETIEQADDDVEPVGKQLKVMRKTELSETDVKLACSICSAAPDPLLHIQQSVFDRAMDLHMKHVHNIMTEVAKSRVERSNMHLDRVPLPEPVKIDDQLKLICPRQNCSTSFGATKTEKYRLHIAHHEMLDKQLEPGESGWPCKDCSFRSAVYSDWLSHRNKVHAKYNFACRHPKCDYQTYCYKYRQHHWQQTHHLHEVSGEPVCEVCGKRFRHMKTLKKHMDQHMGQMVKCTGCDKQFKSESQMKAHHRVHHNGFKFACTLCPAKFIYKNQYESHLVHEHNQERQHACEYCGQRFIQKSHYNRHIKLYHRQAESKTGQKRRERGPNKGPLKKAYIPEGMANATVDSQLQLTDN